MKQKDPALPIHYQKTFDYSKQPICKQYKILFIPINIYLN